MPTSPRLSPRLLQCAAHLSFKPSLSNSLPRLLNALLVPPPRLPQYAARRGVPTVILSDCNSVFISAILAGARANTSVRHVITNSASFHRVPMAEGAAEGADAAATPPARGAGGWGGFFRPSSAAAASKPPLAPTQRCVVEPRHGGAPHGCPLCPSNLCKGRELAALRAAAPGQRVIYAGDGANDLCPSLSLGPDDVVLARAGMPRARRVVGQGRQVHPASCILL